MIFIFEKADEISRREFHVNLNRIYKLGIKKKNIYIYIEKDKLLNKRGSKRMEERVQSV